MDVAVSVNRPRGDTSWSGEALYEGDDEVDSVHRLAKSGRVAHVWAHQFHIGADLLWSVSAPEMYELLVRRRGWSLEQYADFIYRTVAHGLLATA